MCATVDSLGRNKIPRWRVPTKVVRKTLSSTSPLRVCLFNNKAHFRHIASFYPHYNGGRWASPGNWGQQSWRTQLGSQPGVLTFPFSVGLWGRGSALQKALCSYMWGGAIFRGDSVNQCVYGPKWDATQSDWGPICGFPKKSSFLQEKCLLVSSTLKSLPGSVCKAPGGSTMDFSCFLSCILYFLLFLTTKTYLWSSYSGT